MNGGSLEEHLRNSVQSSYLSIQIRISILLDTAFGLCRLHSKGIKHCDIRPANILLDKRLKPKLANLGLA